MRVLLLLALALGVGPLFAEGPLDTPGATASAEPATAASSNAAPTQASIAPKAPSSATTGKNAPAKSNRNGATTAQLQAALDQLTQSNRDLLDLLKKQQAVLEDMQFDRRLQSRQIQSLEERLTTTLYDNTQLQNKVASLEAAAAQRAQSGEAAAPAPAVAISSATNANPVAPAPQPADQASTPNAAPTPPETYLPAPQAEGAPGTKSWHRLFTLKGQDGKQTDLFHVEGRTWRVLWHNQDPPKLANTSALFINAFPRDDTIPQKVCSKLGSGGDITELSGPGNYYLKIEASGGAWELAVEDFK